MRPGFRSLAAAQLLALSVLALAGDAFAAKPMVPNKEALVPDAGDANTPTAVLLSTGFEAVDGFVLGAIEPQNGWVATSINSPWASVSAVNPAVGSQHLRLVRDNASPGGSTRIVLSPPTPLASHTPSQFRGLVYISNDWGADYDFVGQSLSQGLMTWRVKFSYAGVSGFGRGTIFIVEDFGDELGYLDTGVLWTQGAYVELKVQHDPAAGEIRYFYGGALIYTGTIWGGTSVEQIAVVHDNDQWPTEHAGIDAISLLDTPSDPIPARPASWGSIKGLYR
jgi:hypothetical protein